MKIAMILESRIAQFVKALEAKGGTPIYKLSPADARKVLESVQAVDVKKMAADIQDVMIPGADGQVSIRIVRPQGNKEKLPVIMYFHGGGWILGSKETHDRLIRQIANDTQAAVVFVNYTPSPEAQFPIAIEQAYAATAYMAEHGSKYNVDGENLVVMGDSVGGNMATVVALLAQERGGPTIKYQMLFYPVTNAEFTTESYQQFAQGPWLTKASMEWFWNAYAPDIQARKSYKLSPLQASLDQLKMLPPTLIMVNEYDVLRDEGEAYAHKLMQAGVEVSAMRCLGAIHDLVLLNPIADSPIVRSAIALACLSLRKALAK